MARELSCYQYVSSLHQTQWYVYLRHYSFIQVLSRDSLQQVHVALELVAARSVANHWQIHRTTQPEKRRRDKATKNAKRTCTISEHSQTVLMDVNHISKVNKVESELVMPFTLENWLVIVCKRRAELELLNTEIRVAFFQV